MLSDRVDIFWTDNSTNEDGFRVERSIDGGRSWALAATLPSSDGGGALVDEGRPPELRVCYRVTAFNKKWSSTPSNSDCTTPPARPTEELAIAVDARTVRLTWKDNSTVEDGYYVTRRTLDGIDVESLIAQPPANTTSWTDTTATGVSAHAYTVRARKDGGFGTPSGIAVASPYVPPAPPTPSGLAAAASSSTQIAVTWQRVSGADGYQLSRSNTGASGSYQVVGTPGPADIRFLDSGLPASTQFCYQIRAFKGSAYSAASGAACATTPSSPLVAPSGVDVVPTGSSSVRLTWLDNSTNEAGFNVEYAEAPSGPWNLAATLGANTTSMTRHANTERTSCFRVLAFNAAGTSAASAPDCTAPPAAPTYLTAAATEPRSVVLSWADNSSIEDGYVVSRYATGSAGWIDLATLPANATSYRDASITSDLAYYYSVRATRDGGSSDPSTYAQALYASVRPPAPEFIAATYTRDFEGYGWNYFDVWWADVPNEQGYRVEYSPDGVSGWRPYATTGLDVVYVEERFDVFLPLVGSGCYRVFAINSRGESDPSTVACTEVGTPPTNLVASAVSAGIDLLWTDNASFEPGYVVLRSTAIDGEFSEIAWLPPNAGSYHDADVVAGQQYWYLVAVLHNDRNYDWSDLSDYATATAGRQSFAAAVARASSSPSKVTRPPKHFPTIRSRVLKAHVARPKVRR